MFRYGKDQLTVSKALKILEGSLPAIIDMDTRSNIQCSYNHVKAIADQDSAVYGINTGFGSLCSTIIPKEQTSVLQTKLLLSHSVGVGQPVATDISKLMLILKVHSLSKGYSGIAMEVLDRILWHIENEIIPVVPRQGSVGASGDLAPLSHLFLPLIGEGKVFYKNRLLPTKRVLKKYGLLPLVLGPKSGLALINGTQFIAAHAVFVVEKFRNCLTHANLIAAMTVDSLKGSIAPFHEALHQVRPFEGAIYVAKTIKSFLSESEIVTSHKNCKRVQDPYSLRCIPQVHGASREAWLHLKKAVEIEINSVTDNPLIFSENFTVSGGNFHGQPLALPLDYACLAAAELGNISDRRIYLSLEGKTQGVPKLLMNNTGLNSGLMILQYTSAALVSENKSLSFPASADSVPTSMGQEDHVSMGSISARKALHVCHNVLKILAIEMICAAQALDFHRPLQSGKIIEQIHQIIRQKISFAKEDRLFSEDINKAIQLIDSQEILHKLYAQEKSNLISPVHLEEF